MNILFLDGTKGFSPRRLKEKPCGGIITSLTIIPRYLAKKHTVTVMSAHQTTETCDGVSYLPIQSDIRLLPEQDIVIFNRNVLDLSLARHFKDMGAYLVWWLHDIVQISYLPDDAFRDMDKIIALSEYCAQSYSGFYDIDINEFLVIPNGIDSHVFYPPAPGTRRRDLFITASAPVKGFYPLEFAYHNLKRANPDIELRMYSSQKLHDFDNMKEHDQALALMAKAGAKIMDPVPQEELANVFRQATALLMPNHYPEICSNVLLQAQACGLPVIASNIGSASEFILHNYSGLLTKTKPHDMFWWHKDFAELCVKFYLNPTMQDLMSKNCLEGVKDWSVICERWQSVLESSPVAA